MSDAADFAIDRVEALDCHYAHEPWPFAEQDGDAIDRHWAERVAAQPHLFNGQVLLQSRGGLASLPDGRAIFRASYTDVAFKAFLAWRDFGHAVRGFRNGFGMAALRSADGAFILGEMAAHTANAGRVYFPSGTPDRNDIVGTAVDIPGSIRRELAEETGLDLEALVFEDGFTVIQDAVRVGFLQNVQAAETAEALVARIEAALARESMPELARMHVVRSAADFTPAMPGFIIAYLRWAFAQAG